MTSEPFDREQMEALNARALVPLQANGTSGLPNGIVVLMRNNCPYCHSSMQATGYPTQINGVPVTWLNINDARSAQQLTALGIPFDQENGRIVPREVADQDYQGVPTVLRVQDGVAKNVLRVGAFDQPMLEAMGAAVKAQEATRLSAVTNAQDTLVLPTAARSGGVQIG